MAQIILDVSDETLDYFKRFKLTNIGDNKNIDAITEAIKNSTDYENRLKAEKVAMLTEIQLEVEEMSELVTEIHGEEWNEINVIHSQDVLSLIQQKINELKAES